MSPRQAATKERPANAQQLNEQQAQGGAVGRPAAQPPAIYAPRLPYHPALQDRFGIDVTSFRALIDAVFPTATSTDSVFLALAYCKARNLDPFKRVIHIVPIWDKNRGCMVDTIWPGIGELRTTAHRTGLYAGKDETVFGPDVTQQVGRIEMTFPAWAQVTVYRMVGSVRVAFSGAKVRWLETYAVRKRDDDSPNQMWEDRPYGQIEKCAEAAALRAAFPEEIGGDLIDDEVQGKHTLDSSLSRAPVVVDHSTSKSAALARQLEDHKFPEAPVVPVVAQQQEEPPHEPVTQEPEREPVREIVVEQDSKPKMSKLDELMQRVSAAQDEKALQDIHEATFMMPQIEGDKVVAAINDRLAAIQKERIAAAKK